MTEEVKKSTQDMINNAVEWLLRQRSKDGWQGDVRATSYAVQALSLSGFGNSEDAIEHGCDYLGRTQDTDTGAWCQNDGDTAEALRSLLMCGKSREDKAIEEGFKALDGLKVKNAVIRSEAGWVHPNLVARALVSFGQNPTELLGSLAPFLDGGAGYDTKYTSRAVLVYKEARINDDSLLDKAEVFLKKSASNISSLNGEYIGLLVQALVAIGFKFEDGIVQKIVTYLKKIQQDDGSWEDNVKATSQIIIGLNKAGFKYKKPSFWRKKNVARIAILAAMFIVAVSLWFSPLQTSAIYIVNVVELFLGIVVIVQWLNPKTKFQSQS